MEGKKEREEFILKLVITILELFILKMKEELQWQSNTKEKIPKINGNLLKDGMMLMIKNKKNQLPNLLKEKKITMKVLLLNITSLTKIQALMDMIPKELNQTSLNQSKLSILLMTVLSKVKVNLSQALISKLNGLERLR